VVSPPNVIEDARESEPIPTSRPHIGWLAAGLLIGAALTVLALGIDTSGPPVETTIEGLSPQVVGSGIGDQIVGFPDSLVAARRSDGQALELVTWPVAGVSYARDIPVGTVSPPQALAFDVSGRRIATLLPVNGRSDGVLYAGPPDSASIMHPDATGFAWHDSRPSALAFSTSTDGALTVWKSFGNLADSVLVAQLADVSGRIAAWGDWGYALQDTANNAILLLDPDGQRVDAPLAGRILDSHPSGRIAVDLDGLVIYDVVARTMSSYEVEGDILAGRLSPDGLHAAVLTADQVTVVLVDPTARNGSLGSASYPTTHGFPELAWSSNSRFVMLPGYRGITIIDTNGGGTSESMSGDTFISVGIVPFGEGT
jgi:hypothetical protein